MAIEKNSDNFIGTLSQLHLIPSSHIETVPDPDTDFELDFDDFELKSGKSFEKIYFSPQTANFQENEKNADPGKSYTKKIGFRIPKSRSEVTRWFRSRRNFRFSALVQTADNKWWFIERNLLITHMRNQPEDAARYSGYEITLQGEWTEPAPAVNNVDL